MGLFKSNRVVYKPVKDINLGPDSNEFYLQANVKAPRMTGIVVKIVTWLLESRIFGALLLYILKGNNLIHKHVTNADLEEPPLYVPLHDFEDHKEQEVKCLDFDLTPQEKVQVAINCLPTTYDKPINGTKPSLNRWTIMDYFNAYSSGVITPNMLLISLFTLSIFKWCLLGGTKWLHKQRPFTDDACCVKRLRLCGAMLVGKTNMHELGAGTSGINPHYGASRNPYDASRIAGGSSSGSAAVVSAGLCPVALGVDGGGSVRMPAALCGVVGLKPTFGRIPHDGVIPLNWTVGMVGILAGTVEDSLITYAAISGEIPSHQPSSMPAKINLPRLPLTKSISDIKLAKYGKWFDDCSDDVRICCSHALKKLQGRYGWKIVDVTIPEIEVMRLAHYSTIGAECHTSLDSFRDKNLAEFGWDARVALKIYGAFSSMEYIKAQKIRNRQLQFHRKIFSEADVIVSPTTGVTAYPIQSDALKTGELDYVNGAALIRYSIAGNFLGLPAVTVPVGYDKSGLPIGLQFIGRPWAEATLLHLAFAMQAICLSEYRNPAIYYDMLRTK
ncbi:hypothetical protein TSUD_70590 [Trifolium subterraneum]|uniref:Amidase domain-containing protein n=1 Tax=Trifolium subterraneum TaxID=3900 RepID=A0A2Z6N8D1_TRISU|nr:hypothetical protein TSUD_70590 [Trifolium subterraneum]